ncbi:MAG: CpsB/CapC family capsule biosynthesis tyrosine phosphatase [Saprospiraceae bacterium]
MLFFTKKTTQADCSHLGSDLHSHLVPGIDDGAPDVETSLDLVRGLTDLGYKQLVTTPHVNPGVYDNTSERILAEFKTLKNTLDTNEHSIPVQVAAEYFLDENLVDRIKNETLLCLPGGYFLFELSFYGPAPSLNSCIFEVQAKEQLPVLAHPERYKYYFGKNITALEGMRERGCLLQANILSFEGHYGPEVQKQAWILWKEGLVDFLGTDLHHREHLEKIQAFLCTKKGMRLLHDKPYKNQQIPIADA